MKHILRALYLFALFCIFTVVFTGRLGSHGNTKKTETVATQEASFPILSVKTCNETLSRMCGYGTDSDTALRHEDLIVLDNSASFTVLIREFDMTVRRMKYELCDITTQNVLESGTVNAFTRENNKKAVKITLKTDIKPEEEYSVRITLINSNGKRMYYYFRIKQFAAPHLTEKLDFIRTFENNTRSSKPEENEAVIPYLETDSSAPTDTLGYLDIHSDYRLINWNGLHPETVTDSVISVTEFYNEIMTAVVKSVVKLNTGEGEEYFLVEEKYRIRYLGTLIHLLNYERRTEELFDVAHSSLSGSDLKLGIMADPELTLVANADNSKVYFVKNGSLYCFGLADNSLVNVFSSTNQKERMLGIGGKHSIHVVKVEDNGDAVFAVTGYRDRGGYEGREGLFLYYYYSREQRTEELLYVPMDARSLQTGVTDADSFYVSRDRYVYFYAKGGLYSYGLSDGSFVQYSSENAQQRPVFLKEAGCIAFEKNENCICLLYPETKEIKEITADSGEYLRLFGKSLENLLIGYGRSADITRTTDGSETRAMYRLNICNSEGRVLKSYEKSGFYISDVYAEDNIITIMRMIKDDLFSGYYERENDYILIQSVPKQEKITLSCRVTDRMLSEYYISFPSSFRMERLPKMSEAKNTICAVDTTLRLTEAFAGRRLYYVYAFGEAIGSYENAAEAIHRANAATGVVLSEDGRILWSRGIWSNSASLAKLKEVKSSSECSSVLAAEKMLLLQRGITKEPTKEQEKLPIPQLLEAVSQNRVLSLTGATLDEILYYLWNGQPVLVMRSATDAVVLTGYTGSDVTYYDPTKGRSTTVKKESAEQMFAGAGSFYFTFVK